MSDDESVGPPLAQGPMPEQLPPHIDIGRTVFPVLALHPEQRGQVARPDFFGKAFAVAPGVFMTAAHVVSGAAAVGVLGLGGPADDSGKALGGARVEHVEQWPELDIALLFCNVSGVTLLDVWLIERVQMLTDLIAFGYPHAVTRSPAGDRLDIVFRAYKGHVITIRAFERLLGDPSVYEISCPFPEGLSGSPVLLNHSGVLAVAGVVLGESEVIYGGVTHRVGIANLAEDIARLHSDRLGGTLGDRLNLNAALLRHSIEQRTP